MSLFEHLTFGSIVHNGSPIRTPGVSPRPVETARAQALYRATLTADLLERREVGEMALWSSDGGVRVVPGGGAGNDPFFSNLAFDFERFEDAADFIRGEIVPRLMDGAFDEALQDRAAEASEPRRVAVGPSPASTPEIALATAAE